MKLSFQQQERLNELLWDRGEQCPLCGSTAVASNGAYDVGPGERVSVQYVCWNRGTEEKHLIGYGPFMIALEPHEARRIGIS